MEAGITSGWTRTLTYFLHRGKTKQTSRSLFTSDLKVADRTKETLTKAHVEGANGSQQGELVRSTQLLVRQNQRSIMDVTWMISEVQGLDPFMLFRPAWASSLRMCST